ncbi:MAG: hypothetical protein LWW87_09310 [Geobacteraceae bacterium]|nr:hypothetical protein [Geobacteraceae bacterium]
MQSSGSRCHSLLKDHFPLQFTNGYHIDAIGFWCKKCMLIAHPDTVPGTVSRIVAMSEQLLTALVVTLAAELERVTTENTLAYNFV